MRSTLGKVKRNIQYLSHLSSSKHLALWAEKGRRISNSTTIPKISQLNGLTQCQNPNTDALASSFEPVLNHIHEISLSVARSCKRTFSFSELSVRLLAVLPRILVGDVTLRINAAEYDKVNRC